MYRRFFPLAFHQLKDGMVAIGEVLDLETFPGKFSDQLLNGMGFVQFDEAGPPTQTTLLLPEFFRLFGIAIRSLRIGVPDLHIIIEKIQIAVLLMKRPHLGLAWKVSDPFDVAFTDLDKIRRQSAGLWITLAEVLVAPTRAGNVSAAQAVLRALAVSELPLPADGPFPL